MLVLITIPLLCTSNEQLRMNEIQFIGSHNSYKQQMPSLYFWLLRLIDGEVAKALECVLQTHEATQRPLPDHASLKG